MTQLQFYDLQQLGQSIARYCRAMETFRAVRESRESLSAHMRQRFPNMKVEDIRAFLWKQEEGFANTAQAEFEEMRINAYSLGWKFDHKDVHNELTGILRKICTPLEDINV